MGVAVFNYATWAARFPALGAVVGEPLATEYFGEAGDYLDNSDDAMIADVAQRLRFLNLIVAHIAVINGASATGAAGLVGRVSNVSEGSVTIAAELKGFNGDLAAFFAQTPYGVQYWAVTAPYRQMTYIPGTPVYTDVPGYGDPRLWQA